MAVAGVAALIAVPMVAVSTHSWWERRHNRRMNRRKTERHKLL